MERVLQTYAPQQPAACLDAIQFLCDEGRRVIAVKLTASEKRYDIGNFPSYFESFVEFALADPTYGKEFRRVLERLLAKAAVSAK